MTFPVGSHLGNAPTPVVNHDHQIPGFVPDIPQIFPIVYSLKLMSPTLSTPKEHIATITNHHIPYFSPIGWSLTLFSLYFSGRSKTARNHHFFLKGLDRPGGDEPVMKPWVGGWSWNVMKTPAFFSCRKNHLGMVKWTSMKPFSWGIYKNPLGITKATFIGID